MSFSISKQGIYRAKLAAHRVLEQHPSLLWWKTRIRTKPTRDRLRAQLTYRHPVTQASRAATAKRVILPLIETSTYQTFKVLLIGKALEARGAKVKVIRCGNFLDICEIRSATNHQKDPCLSCRFHSRYTLPLYGLDTMELKELVFPMELAEIRKLASTLARDWPRRYDYQGIDIMPIAADSVMRHFYGAVPEAGEELQEIRRKHLITTLVNTLAAARLDRSFSPDVVFNNMAAYSAWAPYFEYFKKRRLGWIHLQANQYDFHTIQLNQLDLYFSNERFQRYLHYRQNRKLSPEEQEKVHNYLRTRTEGEAPIFRELGYFAPESDTAKRFGIHKEKKNLFLFPNIYWDTGMVGLERLFDNVIDWVLQTIELVQNDESVHLYIKPHPGEKFDSSPSAKGIADFVRQKFPTLPKNVTLITPEMKVSPYSLFPYIDLGLVYNGTVGLEMLLKDIPVVIAAKAPYGGLGFGYEPKNLEEYRNVLLAPKTKAQIDREKLELFAYFYFFKTLIPWNLTDRSFADNFKGYRIESLEDIAPGKNKYLDHICNCILDGENTPFEGWE